MTTTKIKAVLFGVGLTLGLCVMSLATMAPLHKPEGPVVLGHRVGPDGNLVLVTQP